MWQHLLVPLDGSPCAEQALPAVARLARANHAAVTLVRVVLPLPDYAYLVDPVLHVQRTREAMQDRVEAKRYLAQVESSPYLDGLEVRTVLLTCSSICELLLFAREQDVDLIVMCSHSYTSWERWLHGSVARHLVRQSVIPLLLLREGGSFKEQSISHPFRVLVALDGTSSAEAVLPAAAQLSASLSKPLSGLLHLVRVVQPRRTRNDPTVLSSTDKRDLARASDYLDETERCLHQGILAPFDVRTTSSLALGSDFAGTLAQVAQQELCTSDVAVNPGCDAIALATHGRSGLARWFQGSVTEQLLERTRLPLLIVRQPQRQSVTSRESASVQRSTPSSHLPVL